MSFKIEVDKEACIGCGACTSCDNFEMNDEGKAVAKESEVSEAGCNQEAADNCPVNCIKIEELQ
jgi:ferredoxin